MVNRRQIVQLALSAGAALPCFKAFAGAQPSLRLYQALYDERSVHTASFATAASRRGVAVQATRGDVTDIWFSELQPEWQQRQSAVAGLTDYHSLFVLDMMAQDAGMRAVYIAAHRPGARGVFEHRLFGPHELVRQASVEVTGRDWASSAAAIVMRCPAEVSVAARHSSIAEARNCEFAAADLVSWVIAPVRKARIERREY
jgi:hypothetical protein